MSDNQHTGAEKSLSRRSVEGTALLIATRFLVRLLGFVSVSVTARLLTPEDFGLVGAASLVIGLFAVLNQVGLGDYIVRTKKIEAAELQTMWSLRLAISVAIAASIYFLAPWAAAFLQEERLEEVLKILCLASVLGALRSPASEFFNRELQYGKDLFLKSADKIVSVVVTIACAYYFRTYWALVWGQLAGMAFAIVSSQFARPFRPSLTFSKTANVGGLAFWTLMLGLNGYGIRQIDEWIAKRSSDSAAFGAYHVARDLCRLFVSEILAPAGQVFFPGAAKVQDDPVRLTEVVSRFAGAAFLAAFAVATGISAIATELVFLLLGYQWGAAIDYIPYIAFGTAAIIVGDLFNGLYIIKNKQNVATRFRFARLLLLLIACSYAANAYGGLLPISKAFSLVSIVTVTCELLWLFSRSRYNVSLLAVFWRPALAALAMYAAIASLPDLTAWPLLAEATVKVLIGAFTYLTVIALLWKLAGCPKGGETEFMDRIRDYL